MKDNRTRVHPSEKVSQYTAVNTSVMEYLRECITLCRDPKRHQDDPVRLMVHIRVTIGNDRVVDVTRTVYDPPALPGLAYDDA